MCDINRLRQPTYFVRRGYIFLGVVRIKSAALVQFDRCVPMETFLGECFESLPFPIKKYINKRRQVCLQKLSKMAIFSYQASLSVI